MDETKYKIKIGLTIIWFASLFGIFLDSIVILKNRFSTGAFSYIQFIAFILMNISVYTILTKMSESINNENE